MLKSGRVRLSFCASPSPRTVPAVGASDRRRLRLGPTAAGTAAARYISTRKQNDASSRPPPTVAIIGSGPAGFYTAQKLMREVQGTRVDMYEQLPVPFGLVRFGVAPDHPEVKNCQDTFEEVAAAPNFEFIGNVNLGSDLKLEVLARHYDAVVFAYGASKDRKLGLPGEDRAHVYSARAFVGWYNGLPEYRHLDPDLRAGDTAVVVGQGNVALDVVRTLLSPLDHLRKTDMTEYALDTLAKSTIKHVRVVGRRGPLQAAFTIKEVRELLHLEDVSFTPIPDDLFPPDLKNLPRPKRRLLELLKKGNSNTEASKSWSLEFLLAPKELVWADDGLRGVLFSQTKLEDPESPDSKVTATNETRLIPASTLFRSIGYKSEAIPGLEELGVEFDDRTGTIKHDGEGRILPKGPQTLPLYCSGWVKRGPTGVIASTMTDAFQTAEAMVQDWRRQKWTTTTKDGWDGVKSEAPNVRPLHWSDWHKIDRAEKAKGAERGKPREKFGQVDDMLAAAGV